MNIVVKTGKEELVRYLAVFLLTSLFLSSMSSRVVFIFPKVISFPSFLYIP